MIRGQDRCKAHEGYRPEVYCDLCGKPWRECMKMREDAISDEDAIECYSGKMTIGWGYNLENGIPEEIAHALFMLKWDQARQTVAETFKSYSWPLSEENAIRIEALTELAYMFGSFPPAKWPKFIAAVNAKDWPAARIELLFAGKRGCPKCGGHQEGVRRGVGCEECEHTGKDHSKFWYDMKSGKPGYQRAERLAEMLRSGRDPVAA